MYSDKSPFFKTIAAADEFLNDVLPSSNYIIQRKAGEINGIKTEIYASPMEGGVTSILCLLEIPEKGLYVVYDELDEDLLKVEEQPAAGSGYFE
ncbi:MAG: hypothetical protein K2I91_00170, partial [Muribaculaceae bacterium]|nr:hypothetical protein [Muribaculaceae bacterium]